MHDSEIHFQIGPLLFFPGARATTMIGVVLNGDRAAGCHLSHDLKVSLCLNRFCIFILATTL